ncbi:MAG: hypothetical protein JWP22_4 [Ramlibacter sp.]|nr:hypothetical protein [Ramlibacter sp.]
MEIWNWMWPVGRNLRGVGPALVGTWRCAANCVPARPYFFSRAVRIGLARLGGCFACGCG